MGSSGLFIVLYVHDNLHCLIALCVSSPNEFYLQLNEKNENREYKHGRDAVTTINKATSVLFDWCGCSSRLFDYCVCVFRSSLFLCVCLVSPGIVSLIERKQMISIDMNRAMVQIQIWSPLCSIRYCCWRCRWIGIFVTDNSAKDLST